MMARRFALVLTLGLACFEDPNDVDPTTSTGPEGSGTSLGSDSTVSTSSTTTVDTSEGSGSTTAPDTSGGTPVCGDGELQGDELCDDGNDTPADGCTGCRPSLTPQWVVPFGSEFGGEAARSLAARPNAVVVGGILGGDQLDGDVWIEILDEQGVSTGHVLTGGTANQADAATDLRTGLDGSIYVTGVLGNVGAPAEVFTRKFSPNLEIEWTVMRSDGVSYDTGVGIGLAPEGAVVIGGTIDVVGDSDAVFVRYDAAGQLVEEYLCDCGVIGGLYDLATSAAGVRAVGVRDSDRVLFGFDGGLPGGPTWEVPLAADQSVVAVDATLDGETVVCGVVTGDNDVSLWLARIDPDGDEIWAVTHDLGDGDQSCEDVARNGQALLAVGAIREDEFTARGFVARFDVATGQMQDLQEIVVEDSTDTRVLTVAAGNDVPTIGGSFAVDDLDDDAFVARLVP